MVDFLEAVSPKGATITSICLTLFGSVSTIEFLQGTSYIIAILAGLVAIYNGTKNWFNGNKSKGNRPNQTF